MVKFLNKIIICIFHNNGFLTKIQHRVTKVDLYKRGWNVTLTDFLIMEPLDSALLRLADGDALNATKIWCSKTFFLYDRLKDYIKVT